MTVIRSQCKDEAEYRQALRDDFAAAALQGIVSNQQCLENLFSTARKEGKKPDQHAAETCYMWADAMLAEREKEPK